MKVESTVIPFAHRFSQAKTATLIAAPRIPEYVEEDNVGSIWWLVNIATGESRVMELAERRTTPPPAIPAGYAAVNAQRVMGKGFLDIYVSSEEDLAALTNREVIA